MAAPFYQNQNSFSVAVPTASGVDITLFSGEVVQGDIYFIFEYNDLLIKVDGPFSYPTLRYSWPGSGGSGGSGTLTGVTCVSPIIGGGSSGVVSVGLGLLSVTGAYIANGTITADKLAADSAVTGLLVGADTLKNIVELVAGTNIVLTPNLTDNSIEIGTNSNVVTAVDATLPLSVTTSNGTATLSIDVTPTNDGGAVAFQSISSEPTVQLGTAALSEVYTSGFVSANVSYSVITDPGTPISGLYVKPLTSNDYAFSAFTAADVLTTYLTNGGTLYTTAVKNNGEVGTTSFSLTEDLWTGTSLPLGYLTAVVANQANNFLNIPFGLYNTLTLLQTTLGTAPSANKVGTGKIVGSPTYEPLIQFGTQVAVPAIKLGITSETGRDLAFAVHDDGSTDPTIGLYTDGTITCKRVDAQYETLKSQLLVAGNFLVTAYPGINVFIIDSSNGPSSIQLPELTAASEDGVVLTFKKYDVTNNPVVISTTAGQTIDVDQTQYTLRTYKQDHGNTVGNPPEALLNSLRVMSVVRPLSNKYFWISF